MHEVAGFNPRGYHKPMNAVYTFRFSEVGQPRRLKSATPRKIIALT